MRNRKRQATVIGAVATLTGLGSVASAGAATVHEPTASHEVPGPAIHALTASQAETLLAAARKGRAAEEAARAKIARQREFVRSADGATPDAIGGHSYPYYCTGSWLVFGGGGGVDAYAATNETCKRFQSLLAIADLSRDRWFGWSGVAHAQHSTGHGEFENAEAIWRCKGVGTYTYRNLFVDADNTGGYSGSIQSRFTC